MKTKIYKTGNKSVRAPKPENLRTAVVVFMRNRIIPIVPAPFRPLYSRQTIDFILFSYPPSPFSRTESPTVFTRRFDAKPKPPRPAASNFYFIRLEMFRPPAKLTPQCSNAVH